jgi:hypothetical protein
MPHKTNKIIKKCDKRQLDQQHKIKEITTIRFNKKLFISTSEDIMFSQIKNQLFSLLQAAGNRKTVRLISPYPKPLF